MKDDKSVRGVNVFLLRLTCFRGAFPRTCFGAFSLLCVEQKKFVRNCGFWVVRRHAQHASMIEEKIPNKIFCQTRCRFSSRSADTDSWWRVQKETNWQSQSETSSLCSCWEAFNFWWDVPQLQTFIFFTWPTLHLWVCFRYVPCRTQPLEAK